MPKFAASLVCPVTSPPRRNAVVEVDNDGVIISVSEGSFSFKESAGVAFYSGILIPGLVDLMCGRGDNPLWQYSRGIRISGTPVLPEDAGLAGNILSPNMPFLKKLDPSQVNLNTSNSSQAISGSPPDNQHDLPRKENYEVQIPTVRYTWNGMYGETVDYVVFKGMDHFNRLFMQGGHCGLYHAVNGIDRLPVVATCGRNDMIGLMLELQEDPAQINFPALLEMASLNGALAAGYEKTAGSLSEGKQPGICIIEGADIANMRLLKGSRLKRLL